MSKQSKNYAEVVDGVKAEWRNPAWASLGTDVAGCKTADDALVAAQLDWEVSLHPVQTVIPSVEGVTTLDIPNKYAVVRDHKTLGFQSLGSVVGKRYTPIQNTDAFDFCTDLVDSGDALFSAAGSLGGGKKVYVAMELPREIRVGGIDPVGQYLLITTTHDGTEPLVASIQSVRFACTNQISGLVRNAQQQFRFRHSASAQGRLQDARAALQVSFAYDDEFQRQADLLLNTPMSDTEFWQFVEQQFPITVRKDEPTQKAITQNENLKADLMGLWRADTQANIANTRWAAYNSIAEYADWFSPVKGNDREIRRAERVITNANENMKQATFAALVAG
jgi:phage/plasmid-like protein (TIGR03299 family)